MAESADDAGHGGSGHGPVPALGHGGGEPIQLDAYGVTVRYTPSHLRVTWANGTEVTLRPADRWITAQVDHIYHPADVVTLTLSARMPVPDPGISSLDIVLAFAGTGEADVRRLADRLNAGWQGGGGAGQGVGPLSALESEFAARLPPAHDPRPLTPEPDEPRTVARPAVTAPGASAHAGQPPAGRGRTAPLAQFPIVMFRADLTAWSDDPEWVGLFPSMETARLIVSQPPGRSHEDSIPPSA